MKIKSRRPISWKLEQYVFGAAALRDEIIRHKREDKEHWNLFKEVGIRVLFIYAIFMTLVIMIGAVLKSGLSELLTELRKEKLRKEKVHYKKDQGEIMYINAIATVIALLISILIIKLSPEELLDLFRLEEEDDE